MTSFVILLVVSISLLYKISSNLFFIISGNKSCKLNSTIIADFSELFIILIKIIAEINISRKSLKCKFVKSDFNIP